MTIRLPMWLFRLLFGRQMADVERRAGLTGKASASKRRSVGVLDVERTLSVERRPK